jgi:hypothetical protein
VIELRCQGRLHGILNEDFVEVKCNSMRCGARKGMVVLHRFSVDDGSFIETLRFKDVEKEVKARDSSRIRSSVRTT